MRFAKQYIYILIGLVLLSGIGGCLVIENKFAGLPPGPWRGVLKLVSVPVMPNPRGEPLPEKVNLKFEEVTQGELPFNFEVIYDDENRFHIEIINGEERLRIDDIAMGADRESAKDTLLIRFPDTDAYIRARYEQNVIEGEWVLPGREDYIVPFVARFGKDYRFTNLRKTPALDLSGRWEATFGLEEETPYPAVGDFRQEGNDLSASFRTAGGEYRALVGTVQADKFYLSTFDGEHALLFEGKIEADGTLIGSFRSGIHYRTIWQARRNPAATLPDAPQPVK